MSFMARSLAAAAVAASPMINAVATRMLVLTLAAVVIAYLVLRRTVQRRRETISRQSEMATARPPPAEARPAL